MPTIHNARATMFGLAHHAHRYERLAGRHAGRLYRRVADDVIAAGLPAGARILDVGTGPGILPLQIATGQPDLLIEAIDLAPEMIDQARRSAADTGQLVTFTVADVAALPYPDDSFDLVLSSISQHHWTDPAAGLSEVHRVLRPGAQAWIYDFRWALGRAENAAAKSVPPLTVSRQSPLPSTSWLNWLNPIGRLMIHKPDTVGDTP